METEDSGDARKHPFYQSLAPRIAQAAGNIDELARLRAEIGPVEARLRADLAAVTACVSEVNAGATAALRQANLKSAKVLGAGTFSAVDRTDYKIDDYPAFVAWLEAERERVVSAHGAAAAGSVYSWLGTSLAKPMVREHLDLHQALPAGVLPSTSQSIRFTKA